MPTEADKVSVATDLTRIKGHKGWVLIVEEFTLRRDRAISELLRCDLGEAERHRQRVLAIDELLRWVDIQIEIGDRAQKRLKKGEPVR